MAIKMDEYEKIRYMKEVERVSQREAAKRLGLSRNTVRKLLEMEKQFHGNAGAAAGAKASPP